MTFYCEETIHINRIYRFNSEKLRTESLSLQILKTIFKRQYKPRVLDVSEKYMSPSHFLSSNRCFKTIIKNLLQSFIVKKLKR